MEIDKSSATFTEALRDFRRARQQAVLEDIMALLTGKPDDLLDYGDVTKKLKTGQSVEQGLQKIPLNDIVGSVGRYADFTRSFLPRSHSDSERWAEVKTAVIEKGQIPPIIVFQIDQAYFVLDGNHRVSIARQQGDTHIMAYVTQFQTDVPLGPDTQPDQLIIKARYADFLARTHLHQVCPEADLNVTAPGQYRVLERQIETYHRRLSRQAGQEISVQQAVKRWYFEIYRPVIQIIRQRGILRHFPDRTETDLYVWVMQHQEELKDELGWEVDPETAASDLMTQISSKSGVARVKEKVVAAITPEPLAAGPPPGQWRKERLPVHQNKLFADILVPVSSEPAQWAGLDQAAIVAQREAGRLHGLHIVPSEQTKNAPHNQQLQAEFERRCHAAGAAGELSFETGRIIRTINDRARWTDVVVIHTTHLPRPKPGDRLMSGLSALVRGCPRPVLVVPGQVSPLKQALLAFDGSPKAREALFVAAYLVGNWGIALTVVTVLEEGQVTANMLESARQYLASQGVEAAFVQEQGEISPAITGTAQQHGCDFIIMGGYGFNPLMEVMLGSEVDQVLRTKKWPVLICR